MRASLTFAIAEHEGAGNQCGDCTSVETARKIVAGEL
jgi:bacterioferritin-associated ferredoxin